MANELMLPPYLFPSVIELEKADTVGMFQPLYGYAVTQRIDYGATFWRAKVSFEKLANSERAALLAFLTAVGRSRAFYLPVYGEAQRGSGVFTELLTNNTFLNGTTGWSASNYTASVADRVYRLTRRGTTASSVGILSNTSAVAVVQYAPHVFRLFRHSHVTKLLVYQLAGTTAFGGQYGSNAPGSNADGLVQFVFVPHDTTSFVALVEQSVAGTFADGDYIEFPWLSLSRCALVDNGLNAMTRSDELDHADWTKVQSSITANAATAPDGTSTADAFVEDTTASATHRMFAATEPARASVAEDLCTYGDFKRGAGTRDIELRVGSDQSNGALAIFDLGAGTAGTPGVFGTATNPRAFIVNLGNGWYRCWLVARVAASTTVTSMYFLVNAGADTYTGDGTSSVYGWRLGCARSAVPCRPVQTVATALPTGTSQALAGSLYTKGWLPSTDGLLKAGDFVNIILPNSLHLARLTSALNSDAAGLAYLQFEPLLPESPADNAAVIPNFPLLKCVLAGVPVVKTYPPGYQSDVEIEVVGVFG